jgi:hypothetical protein
MKFLKLIQTRFADPVTALDLSTKYVCFGSAMGRIAFYDIKDNKELVLFDSQPELIRGISHNESGKKIYLSIGDLCFHTLDANTLASNDPTHIVDDVNDRGHKGDCERSYTMSKNHMAAVLTINMKDKEGDKDNKKFAHLRTLMVLNIETQKYEPHMEEEKDVFT